MSNASWLIWGISASALGLLLALEFRKTRHGARDGRLILSVTTLIAVIAVPILIAFLGTSPAVEIKGAPQQTNWGLIFLMYLAMLAGIIAQLFFFQPDGAVVQIGPLAKAILASPIVFIPLLSAYQGAAYSTGPFTTSDLMLLLVAFQNGFFWKMIFDRQSRNKAKP